jgi:hypothetical protein
MSRSQQHLPQPQHHPKSNHRPIVDTLNDRIRRLGDTILPPYPYFLSIPSHVPYRHNPRFVQTWHVGTPFTKQEEQLQYLTFLPHQGDYEELLKVEGNWADDHGNVTREGSDSRPISRGTPSVLPEQSSGRKKISLQDYKKEKALPESERTPSKSVATTKPPLTSLARPQAAVMASKSPRPSAPKASTRERGRSPARAADKVTSAQIDGHTSPKVAPTDIEDTRPAKKRKVSQSPNRAAARDGDVARKGLPRLLSPTLPASPGEAGLPVLLTPDLPPALLKLMETSPSSDSSDALNQHRRSDSVRSLLGVINEDGGRSTNKTGPQSGSLGAGRVRSDSQHSAKSVSSIAGKSLPTATPLLKSGIATPTQSRSPGPRQKHRIVLKYGKKNRKRVEALLKFKSRPKAIPKVQEIKEPMKAAKPEAVTETGPQKSKLPVVDAIKRPSTPLTNGLRDSKVVSSVGSPPNKSVQATPKKELKSTAMRRVESVDSTDPATPADKTIRSATPSSVELSRQRKQSPLPTSTPGTVADDDRRGWERLDRERAYFTLGRKLKHEAASLFGKAKSESDGQKPILLTIEALLCFMVNTALQGYLRPRHDPGWSTILGYYDFVVGKARHFPHLLGLTYQLGAVCRQAVQRAHLDRLAKDPLPDEHANAAPTPGSDGNTKSEDAEAYRRRYLDLRDELVKNTEELQNAWLKGSKMLSVELLATDYGETWQARNRHFERRASVRPKPTMLSAGFYLPIDPATTPFEAAEYALKLMGEWADREDVDWRASLRL